MIKYITYCLWGDNKVYTYGTVENVIIAKELFTDWTVRVHYNDTVPSFIIEWLSRQDNVDLVHHPGETKSALNMYWRFEDFSIPDATVICRDADSRLSERELGFVNEWLQSDKDFHIIRDHKHHTVTILGGTLGVRNNCLISLPVRTNTNNINDQLYKFLPIMEVMKLYLQGIGYTGYCIDQMFLSSQVYPYIILNTVVHASHNKYEPFCISVDPVDVGFCGEVITTTPRASEIFGDSENDFTRVAVYE